MHRSCHCSHIYYPCARIHYTTPVRQRGLVLDDAVASPNSVNYVKMRNARLAGADLAPRRRGARGSGAAPAWGSRGSSTVAGARGRGELLCCRARQGEELGRGGRVELAPEDATAAGSTTGSTQARGLAGSWRARVWRGVQGLWRWRAWRSGAVGWGCGRSGPVAAAGRLLWCGEMDSRRVVLAGDLLGAARGRDAKSACASWIWFAGRLAVGCR
ncbi:uncharacterized protein LOC123400221 [Hordeum vulgare subsp. vulgare]|uniref:uncharacterized protein LOC123400221 n=1 Tax=Hordeum vulgare subsp. vulgare TaxID=112509 RepID=UPI000B482B1A|nr:uncharacterized protein LOC123400221 [Hordeum vulgare subsp. vulgare]